ncbi:MAG: dipeptide/oligopeptide/nickel ABC transporter permease/ATP-binding protein [Flexistipes sinusarabici]|uniref:Dipeptide/oligopeptide/nickel ABC transporter permease/ATP-binding protein n=2 Tax=Flexistipes sinusarabici TaxID=2352 RepID=A0A5D0MW61_FLESI|nr:MAG: dipeptide/oligopeptide/nickel ABC transporter permease/ATP-binding protein [Flexistipes sinusarabici]
MRTFISKFSRNRLALAGLLMLLFVIIVVLCAPILPLQEPNETNLANRLLKPVGENYILGTDHLGRDILSRIIWGTRVSLAVGIVATLFSALVGTIIGIVSGFYGKIVDNVLMRGIDMIMAFPYMLLALSIVAVLGPGLMNALFAIAIVNIPFFARNVRGATVSLVRLEYVDASRVSGLNNFQIIFKELLPNVMPVIIITMSTTVGWMILETAGLSFLGLGAQPPQADLGSMLGEGRKMVMVAPHVATIPGLMILFVVIAINLVGDGLRDYFDPRLSSGALISPAAFTDVAGNATEHVKAEKIKNTPLQIRNLNTWFITDNETYKAVNDVSFHLSRRECLGVMGESGSGKSVTALSVASLVASPPGKIVSGSILLENKELVGASLSELQNIRGKDIAYIFQNPLTTLNPLLKIGEQLAETILKHQPVSRSKAYDTAEELLKNVHIPKARSRLNSYPFQLSGGMRQRVGIAMALANNPGIIIADEPTTALDVTIQAQILRLMDELRHKYNNSLIFISHDFGVISELCDRIIVMYSGEIVEIGTVDEIYKAALHPYTKKLMSCVPEVGRKNQKIEAIKGLPPAVNKLPSGCFFADRCDFAIEKCREHNIPLREFGEKRKVRCIRAEELT